MAGDRNVNGHGNVVTLMTGEPAARRRVDAAPGSAVVVGSCPCAECRTDLVLGARPGAWFRAVIRVGTDHWELDNLSLDAEAWLVDLENPTSRVSAAPGRRRLIGPFEFADLSFRVGPCEAGEHVTVIGPEAPLTVGRTACRASTAPLVGAGLQPGTAYHAVLEELCRGASDDGVAPTAAALSVRLHTRGWAITPKAVEHHVDYLFQRCFPGEAGRARGWKRTALVSLITRTQALAATRVGGLVKGGRTPVPPMSGELSPVVGLARTTTE